MKYLNYIKSSLKVTGAFFIEIFMTFGCHVVRGLWVCPPPILRYRRWGDTVVCIRSAIWGGFGRDQNIAGRNLKQKGKKTS